MLLENLRTVLSVLNILGDFVGDIPRTYYIISTNLSYTNAIFEYQFPQADIERTNFLLNNKFPDKFYFGVATTAYECEGAWNTNGKGESVWDYMTHANPNLISDQTNGDISSDFYHMYAQDIQLASNIGVTMMRISLSWSRILPNGYNNQISQSGISFYDNVIDEMLLNNIIPMISLFDDDMPYSLQQLGGWTNPIIVDIFVDYAKIAFSSFADRVQYWTTINDPAKMCRYGYGGMEIPAMNMSGIADYLCGHHVLLAHAKAYKLYHQAYNYQGNGKLGILNHYTWFVPERNSSELDAAAAERAHIFYNDWLTYPIFSETGDYPAIMKSEINSNSFAEGFSSSRIPIFNTSEIEEIKGSADFLGINYYTATSVENALYDQIITSFNKDAGIYEVENTCWPGGIKIKNTPWALTKLLHRLHNDYSLPDLWITANGYADFGGNIDWERVVYLREHIKVVLKAMQDGVNIQGYLVKSLTDGFEYMNGYQIKFGLFHVNFNDSNLARTPKVSAAVMEDLFKTKEISSLEQIYKRFQDELDIIKIMKDVEQLIAQIYLFY